MAGVVVGIDGQWSAQRVLRDEVLDCLYGKASADPRRLIDEALRVFLDIASAGGTDAISSLGDDVMGLHPGPMRTTDALNLGDALRQAVLLHASMSRVDGWDDLEESDTPAPEEVNRRFATEVREAVLQSQPQLARFFSRSGALTDGGRLVRFGFLSDRAVMHFSVLHPVRQAASVRDARARLWELSRAKDLAGFARAALITAVPRHNDPTLGTRQLEELRANRVEVEREADDVGIRLHAVTSVELACEKVLETV